MKDLNVDKEVYFKFFTEKILPAIRRKFPSSTSRLIRIQQDNAPAHGLVSMQNEEFVQAVQRNGLNIEFKPQVGNSPDTNVLDLGFFNSIQALQQSKRMQSKEDIIEATKEAFNGLHRETLEKVFLSHQAVCGEIILHEGSNEYKMPHYKKNSLKGADSLLPLSIPLKPEIALKAQTLRPALFGDADEVTGVTEPPQMV